MAGGRIFHQQLRPGDVHSDAMDAQMTQVAGCDPAAMDATRSSNSMMCMQMIHFTISYWLSIILRRMMR